MRVLCLYEDDDDGGGDGDEVPRYVNAERWEKRKRAC